jgi:alpha-glucosidase (family GH31 glycosyl hydrolase)
LRWWALLLVFAASAQERQGNRFVFQSKDGVAELEWISPSTFRFRRAFAAQLPPRSDSNSEAVEIAVKQSAAEVSFTTTYLKAIVRKDDLRVDVRKAAGDSVLMKDVTPVTRRNGVISWERLAEPGVRYYGLGGKTGDSLNLRGARIENAVPFLLSTAGYGEQHIARGQYDFDVARLRRGSYRIDVHDSDTIDYYVFYGPTPKEIFEERLKTLGASFAPHADPPRFQWLLEQSLSGVMLPAETVTQPVPSDLKTRLGAYLGAYIQEVHDRGCPILHPLPVQFPRDPEADKYPDEAMLGDELLLTVGRSAYLPPGIWTNLKSNTVTRGRQVIQTPDTPSVFARNGSIVPLAGSGTLELHYFPKLGAEFFLYEDDAGEYTQAHAAPAADIMRLEIESKVARDYTWVVHHIEGVTSVALVDVPFQKVMTATELRDRSWYYDPLLRNLYVRDRVAAGQDHIVNLSF